MPEMTFTVRWPDGNVQECYSPSLVMHDHLVSGNSYPVEDFVSRSAAGLILASDRVRAKYGMICTSAMAQLDEINEQARSLTPAVRATGSVTVLTMFPPLPHAVPEGGTR